jgi:putative FmdB family regulatory protein
MPLYEYECDTCGHRFEVIQKFSDAPIERCPKCGGSVHKMQSAPAFQFKGSGWYITDYARKAEPAAGKSDGSPKQETAGEKKDSSDQKEAPAKTEKPAEKTGTTETKSSADPKST